MSAFRVEKKSNFTVMSNYHLRDKKLSLKAKGLLSLMLSLPEKWDYSLKGLSCIGKEGVYAIRNAVNELEQYGYIVRRKAENTRKRVISTEYLIYEQPVYLQPMLKNPILDNPMLENCTQINKDINK